MNWVTWRQQRTEITVAALSLVGALIALGTIRVAAGRDYSALIDACHGSPVSSCGGAAAFLDKWGWATIPMLALYGAPLIAAVFIGAPLVAREIEHRTYLLAWSQDVTRTRWLAIKLWWIVMGGIAIGAILCLFVSWWRQPFDGLAGTHMSLDSFDQEGTLAIGVFSFAICLAVAAGAVLRNTLSAIALTLVVFTMFRIGIALIGLHLVPSVTWQPSVTESGIVQSSPPLGLTIAQWAVAVPCPPQVPQGETCESDAMQVVTDTEFWRLQLAETGVYLALAAGFVLAAFWGVERKAT